MFKACLVGAAVTFALIAVPVVHFVTGIPSAFIGGYFAGSRAAASPRAALLIGGVMGLLLVAPIAGVFLVMSLFFGFGVTTVAVLSAAFAVWTVLLASLGAVLGGSSVRRQAQQG